MTARPADDDEVDLTLIDELLALTPVERLLEHDRALRAIEAIRDGLGTADDLERVRRRRCFEVATRRF